jgi:class 3 adenylate cyclase
MTIDDIFSAAIFVGVDKALLVRAVREEMGVEFDGDYLLRSDDPPDALFVILDGTVDIIGRDAKGREIKLADRGPGAIVGEQAFIDMSRASADVRAAGRVSAVRLPARSVEILREDPSFVWNLLRAVSSKLRQATNDRTRHRLEQRLLFGSFRAHVPPQLVDSIIRNGDDAGAPREVEAVIMFSDLRNFTELSTSMSPEDIADQLSPYFNLMVDIIHRNDGIVDKYIGDAVMAVWGHPALSPADPNCVLDAVLEMLRSSRSLTFGGRSVRIGVGLEFGRVFLGNVGTENRKAFTVLGNAVNLASRYESLNKSDGGPFDCTVGPAFYARLDEGRRKLFIERKNVAVKGSPEGTQTVFSFKDGGC